MDDDLRFEERKTPVRNINRDNEFEYSKGGGGGSSGFFSIKTNVYSRQCYSDPNNPGKMICKEIKNSSGYDPFNKENNFKNSRENVYTKEYGNSNEYIDSNQNPSFIEKISGKIKGIFRDDSEENSKKYSTNPINQNNQFFTDRESGNNSNHCNLRDNYSFNIDIDSDPLIDHIDKIFNSMQNDFIRGVFNSSGFDRNDDFDRSGRYDRDPFDEFFNNQGFHHEPRNNFRSDNDNYSFNSDDIRGHGNFNRENFKDFKRTNSYFDNNNVNPTKMKYSDSKIYDV